MDRRRWNGPLPLARTRRSVAGAAMGLRAGAGVARAPGRSPPAPDLLIEGATVVDTRDGALRRGMAVLIHDGRIAAVARDGSIRPAAGGRRIAAQGEYLVPGFLDMHAHPLNAPAPQAALSLMVAYGITGFRQMSGSPALLAGKRAGTLPMGPVAPALLAAPGTVLAGRLATDPAAAVAEVDAQKADDADFIKVIDLRPPAFFAALDRAHADGLTFGGHLPPDVDGREAARRGMRNIEHLGPNDSLLLSCSADERAIRAATASAPATKVDFAAPPTAVKRLTANPMLSLPPPAFARERRVLATYDEAKCRALARELAARGVWQVPTLVRLRAMELADDPALAAQPELRYVPADDRRLWNEVRDAFSTRLSPADRDTLKALWARQLALVKLFDDAGVPMMAGTDLGGQWIVPGASLHQEFDLLAAAGLPPLRILRMATLDAARFLGREATMGSVEPGRNADLVLLDGDPTASVANLHRIAAVVRAGTYYGRRDLQVMVARVAAGAAPTADHGGTPAGAMGDEQ